MGLIAPWKIITPWEIPNGRVHNAHKDRRGTTALKEYFFYSQTIRAFSSSARKSLNWMLIWRLWRRILNCPIVSAVSLSLIDFVPGPSRQIAGQGKPWKDESATDM